MMRIYSLYRRIISMEIALKKTSSSYATIFYENQTYFRLILLSFMIQLKSIQVVLFSQTFD